MLTVIFLVTVVTLQPFAIPTTSGALLSAIRDRRNAPPGAAQRALATSGRAAEAAGDADVLLLDKTGTITLGSRRYRLARSMRAKVAFQGCDARGPAGRRAAVER